MLFRSRPSKTRRNMTASPPNTTRRRAVSRTSAGIEQYSCSSRYSSTPGLLTLWALAFIETDCHDHGKLCLCTPGSLHVLVLSLIYLLIESHVNCPQAITLVREVVEGPPIVRVAYMRQNRQPFQPHRPRTLLVRAWSKTQASSAVR